MYAGNEALMTILEWSISGAVLVVAVTAVRRITLQQLPKGTFVALWWISAIRLLVPAALPFRFSIYTLLNRLAAVPEKGPLPAAPAEPPPAPAGMFLPSEPPAPAAAAAPAAFPVCAVLYVTVAVLLAAWFAVSYLRWMRRFRESLPVEGPCAARWLEGHPRIRLRRSSQIAAPLTYGLFRPVILLPDTMDLTDEAALLCILTHESVHIRRKDGLLKLALAAALCVHWFNPAVWLLYTLANRDMELRCDEAAVQKLGSRYRKQYALTLIRMAELRNGSMPLYSSFSESCMEERIKAIMNFKKHSGGAILLALILVTCITAVFTTSARAGEPDGGVPSSQTPQMPLEQLEASFHWEDTTFHFTIPDGEANWSIQINGRLLSENGEGMSVHYLEQETASGTWLPGATYSFETGFAVLDELLMEAVCGEESALFDLMPDSALRAESSKETSAQWDALLAPYLPFGLNYSFDDPDHDGNGLKMYFQGREVRGILDNNQWITEHAGNGTYGEDAGELYAVYENGVLSGLEFAGGEDATLWTELREAASSGGPGEEALLWPVDSEKITAFFGSRANPGGDGAAVHNGVDIGGMERGAPVYAAMSGTVKEAGYDSADGNCVWIDHGSGLETLYCHCASLQVKAGDFVAAGQTIATVGSTGLSTGPHLHFEIWVNGEPVDPVAYFQEPAT